MDNKNFMNADDVARFMGISKPTAYRVIRELNQELKTKGYLTISGIVSSSFFKEKVYCPEQEVRSYARV